ncbi:MAG: hypothetical protein O3A55_06740 [Bacteroidetes bacterium]|nr:hypothetical protein [Bacteroidota bacterium]
MTIETEDIYIFSKENIHKQIKTAPFKQGFFIIKFYTSSGKFSKVVTETLSKFYLYPSGGTLRDSSFNLIFYDSQFDTYRGFEPPKQN